MQSLNDSVAYREINKTVLIQGQRFFALIGINKNNNQMEISRCQPNHNSNILFVRLLERIRFTVDYFSRSTSVRVLHFEQKISNRHTQVRQI